MDQSRRLNSNQKLLILSGFVFIIVLSSILTFSWSVFILQMIMGLITLHFCFKTDFKTAKLLLGIFMFSLLFVFLIYLANQSYFGLPYYNGGSDDLQFEQWGYDVYNSGIYNPSKIMELRILGQFHNSPFFPIYIAVLIKFSEFFGGFSTFLPRIANVYFLIWISLITKYLLEKYTNLSQKTILYSICFFAFMPNIQYINAHVFRDTFNLLQVLMITLLFDFLLRNKNYKLKFISLISLPFLTYSTYYTRVSSIIFAGVAVLLMMSVIYKIKTRYILIGIISLVLLTNLMEAFRVSYYIETYTSYVSNIAGDGLSSLVFNQPLLPIGIIFRAIYALISPFPNFFALFRDESKVLFDSVQFLIYLGVLVQIFSIPFLFKRLIKLDWLSLIFISWFSAIIISTFTFRHFLFFYPFMGAIVVDGYMTTSKNSRKTLLLLSIFITAGFGMIYAALKIL